MKLSGRIERAMWEARLQLRKSELLRRLVRAVRGMTPDTRERHLRAEVRFWNRWVASEGLGWPDDYASRFDPAAPVQEHLARVIDRIPRPEVEILDVGAGAATVIGKVHPTKQLSITATDPLAREYNATLDRFGAVPPVRTTVGSAENLEDAIGSRQFDIVYAQNSLDHSSDPIAGIQQMLAATRPGGFVVLLHEENEGQNEMYHAMHKWDFFCQHGRFMIAGPGPRGPRHDITQLVAGEADVECSFYGEEILVVMRKLGPQDLPAT